MNDEHAPGAVEFESIEEIVQAAGRDFRSGHFARAARLLESIILEIRGNVKGSSVVRPPANNEVQHSDSDDVDEELFCGVSVAIRLCYKAVRRESQLGAMARQLFVSLPQDYDHVLHELSQLYPVVVEEAERALQRWSVMLFGCSFVVVLTLATDLISQSGRHTRYDGKVQRDNRCKLWYHNA
jgi:hypothetical protein